MGAGYKELFIDIGFFFGEVGGATLLYNISKILIFILDSKYVRELQSCKPFYRAQNQVNEKDGQKVVQFSMKSLTQAEMSCIIVKTYWFTFSKHICHMWAGV